MKKITPGAVHATLAKHYPPHVLGWAKRAAWKHDPAVPLTRIDMARRPGARDPQKVAAIAEAVKDGKPMPPVVLVNTGESKLAIADGYHRTLGFLHAGKRTIPAVVASGVGKHGPWETRMHAAKLNLTAAHVHTVDLAGVCTGPGPCDVTPLGAGKNWLQKVNGLPLYIRAIAHSLRRGGMDESRAISTAIATVKRWAAGGGNVTAETRARAAKAVAEWEAKKAASHALTASPTPTVDLAQSVMATTDGPMLTMPARMTAAAKGQALPGGRFPIRTHDEVRKAVRAVGRAKGDHTAVRRFIIKRAKALGGTHLIPDHWHADGTVDMTATASATIDLTFTEQLHPRTPKGNTGGGRFAAKNGGSASGTPEMNAQVRDFQRRTGLPVTGTIDTATAARINRLTSPKTGGSGGGKSKAGKASKAAAAAKHAAGATASAVNRLSVRDRLVYRILHPTAPAGYVWSKNNTLTLSTPQSRAVARIIGRR